MVYLLTRVTFLYNKLEFSKNPANSTSKYLNQTLFLVFDSSVHEFIERLNDLNHYLFFLSEKYSKQLDQEIRHINLTTLPVDSEKSITSNVDKTIPLNGIQSFQDLQFLRKIGQQQ
jgi:hypothetical protein